MKLKILILLVLITFLVYPVNALFDYNVTTLSSQNTALQEMNTSFGDMYAGNTLILSPSFNLTNSGNAEAIVSATFTTEYDGIYGFTNTSGVIGGANFSIQKDGNAWDVLNNLITHTVLGNVPADDIPYYWNTCLTVPAGQSTLHYMGIIQLTFS